MSQVIHILGGGLAGLAAAIRLAKFGFKPVIIEKNHYLGGRVRSFTDQETGDEIDNGQHLIMANCTNLLQFLREIKNPDGFEIQKKFHIPFIRVASKGPQQKELAIPALPYPLHLLASVPDRRFFSVRDKLALFHLLKLKTVSPDEYFHKSALEILIEFRQTDSLIRDFWNPFLESALNSSIDQINGKLFIILIKETLLRGGHYLKLGFPKEGLSRVLINPAEKILNQLRVTVIKKKLIKNILFSKNNEAVSAVVDNEENEIPVETLISTVPQRNLIKIIPAPVKTMLWGEDYDTFEYSPIISIHLWTKTPITHQPYLAFLNSKIHWLFNKRVYGGPLYSNYFVYQLTISNATELATRAPLSLESDIKEELKKLFPKFDIGDLVKMKIIKEKFATPVSNSFNEKRRLNYKAPVKNLFIAGDWSNTGLPYTMESAILSGFRVADEIISKRYFNT
ncbi:MAG: hydroxysqualene dehydroxylase HpnE [Calditrichia bacterium]